MICRDEFPSGSITAAYIDSLHKTLNSYMMCHELQSTYFSQQPEHNCYRFC